MAGNGKDVKVFAENCVFIRSVRVHSQTLFESGDQDERRRMSKIANTFFSDLNHVLNEYVILQVCKITDPARDRKSENLTIAFLLEQCDFSSCLEKRAKANALNARIDAFRQLLLPARNKRIAHADHAAAFAPEPLGAAPKEGWEKFWLDLDEMINLIYETQLGESFHLNEVGMISDADGLTKALKSAECFEKMLSSKDADLSRKCADVFFGVS